MALQNITSLVSQKAQGFANIIFFSVNSFCIVVV